MRRLASLLVFLLGVSHVLADAHCQIDASTILIEDVYRNQAVAKDESPATTFSWVNSYCSAAQTNHQTVQWQMPLDGPTYCNSGTSAKGDATATTTNCRKLGGNNYGPDQAMYPLTYGVRVQIDPNDAGWVNRPFAIRPYARSMRPEAPGNVAVVSGGTYDANLAFTPWPLADPNDVETFYADPNGSGTDGQCETSAKDPNVGVSFQAAVTCLDNAGDTLAMRNGTYTGAFTMNKSGNATNPLTIRAVNAGQATFLTNSAFSSAFLCNNCQWVIVKDVKISGVAIDPNSSNRHGISFAGGHNVVLENISLDPNMPAGSIPISFLRHEATGTRARDTVIRNSVFSANVYDFIEYLGAGPGHHILDNEFTTPDPNHTVNSCIHVHGGSPDGTPESVLVEGNHFHDTRLGSHGCIGLYLGAQGSVVRDNIFDTLVQTLGGPSAAVLVLRSGRVMIEHNTFFRTDYGVAIGERSTFTTVRSNFFRSNTNAALTNETCECSNRTRCEGITLGHVIQNNYYSSNGANVAWRPNCTGLDAPRFDDGGVSSDCNMVDPNGGNFSLQAGSPCIDVATSGAAVPAGGGTKRDIGAVEAGTSGPPYASYEANQPGRSNLRWTFNDPTLLLRQLWPGLYDAADSQTAFEVQADTQPDFRSVLTLHPLYERALTASTSNSYVLDPNLPSGTYHIRVRTADAQDPNSVNARGVWSDRRIVFTVP